MTFFEKEYKELSAWLDAANETDRIINELTHKSCGAALIKELVDKKQCSIEQYEQLEFYLGFIKGIYKRQVSAKEELYKHRNKLIALLAEFKEPNSSQRMSFYLCKIMEKAKEECTPEEYEELKTKANSLERQV